MVRTSFDHSPFDRPWILFRRLFRRGVGFVHPQWITMTKNSDDISTGRGLCVYVCVCVASRGVRYWTTFTLWLLHIFPSLKINFELLKIRARLSMILVYNLNLPVLVVYGSLKYYVPFFENFEYHPFPVVTSSDKAFNPSKRFYIRLWYLGPSQLKVYKKL